MWPEAIRAVQELRPKAFIFENVRGLLRPAFEEYLEFLQLQLSWLEIKDPSRGWQEQRKRLRARGSKEAPVSYSVLVQGINAADYGAPQRRHRAMIVGVRSDIAERITFPAPTHSRDALVWDQRHTGDYWERHSVPRGARPALSEQDRFILERLQDREKAPRGRPWKTVRDAIKGLPSPAAVRAAVANHRLHPGARVYARHTGSTLDEPAKALKAGDHGVPGGENILVGRRGSVRYFTLREMARLQGLPDNFVLEDGWKSPIKQLGNAVPVQVGRAFGKAVRTLIMA